MTRGDSLIILTWRSEGVFNTLATPRRLGVQALPYGFLQCGGDATRVVLVWNSLLSDGVSALVLGLLAPPSI